MGTQARVTLRVTNNLDTARTVVLEPWAGEYTLRPGGAFDVVAEGDINHPLQIELIEDRVIVYCFDSEGAEMSVFENGVELRAS